jgi:1-acyl-sn-glycerol-3-phosphate acyltransferase
MNDTFHFESSLIVPNEFDGNRYMFSCVSAAYHFVSLHERRQQGSEKNSSNHPSMSSLRVAGPRHTLLSSDLWWAWTQPRGNLFVRLAGLIAIKLLRVITTEVTVDVESFSHVQKCKDQTRPEVAKHIILAPTHRSFLDFIVISYVLFALPEINIPIPFIAAADEFSRLSFFGWFARKTHAFFVKRGKGFDPGLAKKLRRLKDAAGPDGACIEVFIEGTRSRDRRFVKPKTGFLR